MERIDIHSHIVPEGYPAVFVRYAEGCTEPAVVRENGSTVKLYDGGKFRMPMDEAMFGPEAVLAQMDRTGIRMNLISGVPDPGILPADRQPEACTDLNDRVAEIVRAHPGRVRGIGVLPWACPEEAAKEAARIKGLGFVAVMLYSHSGPLLVDDPILDPTYGACETLGLPLFLHPDIPLWYRQISAYNLVSTVGLVLENSLALLRILESGAMERFPRLQWIMPHAGGVLPSLDGRVSYTPRPFRRFVPEGRKPLSERLRNPNLWFDVSNPSVAVLKTAREYLGADRLMFGSDYPFTDQEDLMGMIQESGFTAGELEGIYWRNAERLFGKLL
jgi:predicted TIM-barrel fold metal-dependent hydrolase